MSDAVAAPPDLDGLLAPRSIALLGASIRDNSFGQALLDMAVGGGFEGSIYPIHPRYRESGGIPFFSSLSELPAVVDHVVVAVAAERVEGCLIEAAEHGARAATVFADGAGARFRDRLQAIARETGLAICGPNSMGFHNLDIGLRITPFPAPKNLVPGGIAAILQSGSVMGALAHNDRRLRFNLLVSTGSEVSVTAADYLLWAMAQPTTRVIGLFLETVRDPAVFREALRMAEDRRLPVVLLKVGRTEIARRMALSHTGAVLGEHRVFEAVAREHGVHMVHTLDEMAASLLLFSQHRAAPSGGIASIHDSGGERELLVDLAGDLELPLARLAPLTLERISAQLEPGMEPDNPLDAWRSGKHAEETFLESFAAMMADDAVAVGLYVLDWRDHYYLHEMHARVLIQVARSTAKPVLAVSNYSLSHDQALADRLGDHGLPLLEGTREALLAVKQCLAHRDWRIRDRQSYVEHPEVESLRRVLASQDWVSEAFGYGLLSAYGVSTPTVESVDTRAGALAAAEHLGYPVVLKTARPGIAHKSDLGGVCLNLMDPGSVGLAYDGLCRAHGARVLVCQMVPGNSEWIIGVINDRDFGPAVMIGPGGTLVELLNERAVLPAPFEAADAARALSTLKAVAVLQGFRGRPPLAMEALCEAAARVSRLAVDFRDHIDQMDINPILVSTSTAIAVDVLITKAADPTG
jgi:acyl-CoA synthetase (NDP forming)